MSSNYQDLIASSRVSSPTRQRLVERSLPDDPAYVPKVLNAASLDTLRALINRVIPQSPPQHIDLAARIDHRLAQGLGDGWRFAALPADPAAYRLGLRTLDRAATRRFGTSFVHLPAAQQDELLTIAAAGESGSNGDQDHAVHDRGDRDLDDAQLRAWFEEVRADAVRQYVGYPGTLARIGYSGIANGGDGLPKTGFVRVGLGEREDWEPLPSRGEAPWT